MRKVLEALYGSLEKKDDAGKLKVLKASAKQIEALHAGLMKITKKTTVPKGVAAEAGRLVAQMAKLVEYVKLLRLGQAPK